VQRRHVAALPALGSGGAGDRALQGVDRDRQVAEDRQDLLLLLAPAGAALLQPPRQVPEERARRAGTWPTGWRAGRGRRRPTSAAATPATRSPGSAR
jgi:hypothetical protein